MKRVLVKSGLVLLLLTAVFAPVRATGVPIIGVYFDEALTQLHADCPDSPPGSVLDTLYVAVSGFTTPIEGIEFQIDFPPEIVWVDCVELENGLTIGDPVSGAAMAFFTPQDASSPVIIQELIVLWLCQGCEDNPDRFITIVAHPLSGSLRAVTSDLAFEDVVAYTSVVCPQYLYHEPQGNTTTTRTMPAGYAAEECVLDCPAGDGGIILPGTLPGEHHTPDLDDDGLVAIVDFALFALAFMNPPIFDFDKDFYCSGNVDLIDFVLFTRHWQHSEITPVESSTWGKIKARFTD